MQFTSMITVVDGTQHRDRTIANFDLLWQLAQPRWNLCSVYEVQYLCDQYAL